VLAVGELDQQTASLKVLPFQSSTSPPSRRRVSASAAASSLALHLDGPVDLSRRLLQRVMPVYWTLSMRVKVSPTCAAAVRAEPCARGDREAAVAMPALEARIADRLALAELDAAVAVHTRRRTRAAPLADLRDASAFSIPRRRRCVAADRAHEIAGQAARIGAGEPGRR